MTNPAPHRETAQALDNLRRRARSRVLRWGWAQWAAAAAPGLLAAVWAVGGPQRPGAAISAGLGLLWVLGAVLLWRRLVLAPARRYADRRRLAAFLDAAGAHRNVLRAAEEAVRRPERWPADQPVARELARRVAEGAVRVLAEVDPARIEPRRGGVALAAILATTCVLGVAAVSLAPGEMARGLMRLLLPAAAEQVAVTGGLYALADREFVVAGRDLTLRAVDFAGGDGSAVCEVRLGQGAWQTLPATLVAGAAPAAGLQAAYRLWTVDLPDVREDVTWRFRRGSLASADVALPVHHPPLLTTLAATVTPPAYTRLPAQDLRRLPTRFEVPAGSRLDLRGAANNALEGAVIRFTDGDSLAAAVTGNGLVAGWICGEGSSFRVGLTDARGLRNLEPLGYEVVAVPDGAPAVTLRREDDDGVLPLAGELVLAAGAADDYGLTRLSLLTRVVGADDDPSAGEDAGGGWRGGAFWPGAGSAGVALETAAGTLRVVPERLDDDEAALGARFALTVDAQALDLVPGDALELVVEAVDNLVPGAPNRGRSRVLRLVLPSAADVLTAQAESSEQRRGELEAMRSRSRELGADLDRLTRELMKNPIPDWARQKEMEAAIERQRSLQDELARVAEQLRRELEKLAASQLTTEAQLERADQMQELLGPSSSEGLQQLLEKMESAAGQVSPQELTRAMDEVARQQKEMARKLDAALALLKRMAEEQELDGLVSLLEKMLQKQQELADLSRELAERQAEEKARQEQRGDTDQSGQEREQAAADAAADSSQAGGEGERSPTAGSEQEQAQDQAAAQDQEAAGENSPEDARADGQDGEQGERDAADERPGTEELARRQQALEQELDQLMEKLEQALADLQQQNAEKAREGQPPGQAEQQMEQALRDALEKMEQGRDSDNMGKAAEALQQMDPEQAARLQEQSLRDLASLYSVLLKSQQAMQSAMQMEQVESLRGLAADMLAVSARQEEIAARIPPGLRDVRSLELTRDQHRLQRALENVRAGLADLMEDAPNRIVRLLEKVDVISEEMGEGVRALDENRAAAARDHTRASLAEANRLVISLLTEAQMNSSGSGGGGSPTPSLSEQLQQLAQEQASLNGATDELRRMLANRGMSQEARAQMGRLGEDQAALAQRMGELAEQEREQPEGERMLGDLAEMGADMERIGRDLDDGLVSEETLIRQERILSRMLDARNSVRRRDYSNRRESESAEDLFVRQGGRGEGEGEGENDPLRRRYQPLESAPLEYRDLVRRYFAALDSLRTLDAGPPPATPRGDTP